MNENTNEPAGSVPAAVEVVCEFCGATFPSDPEWAWLPICDDCGLPTEGEDETEHAHPTGKRRAA